MIFFHLQSEHHGHTLQYWPFAQEYSIWNAAVAALQFWTEDLKPHVLSHAIYWVYAAFFYSDHTQQIRNLPEEILFSHFVTTLNDAFEIELAQEDEGYESGSENFHIPTHSAEPWESTMSPQWMSYPSIWQTLVNHLPLQSTSAESSPHKYRSHNLTCHCWLVFTNLDDESPNEIQWMHAANAPALMTEVETPGKQTFHLLSHHNLCHHITTTSD